MAQETTPLLAGAIKRDDNLVAFSQNLLFI